MQSVHDTLSITRLIILKIFNASINENRNLISSQFPYFFFKKGITINCCWHWFYARLAYIGVHWCIQHSNNVFERSINLSLIFVVNICETLISKRLPDVKNIISCKTWFLLCDHGVLLEFCYKRLLFWAKIQFKIFKFYLPYNIINRKVLIQK